MLDALGQFLFRRRNLVLPTRGYSDEEIQRKREALENVLVPYRIEENVSLLQACGFRAVDTYYRWFNFACMVAIR